MPDGRPNLHGKQLAQLLRQVRADAQVSGRELARRSYISQPKISRIESGEVTPSLADVESLVRALNVDDDLASTLRDLAMRSATEHRSIRQMSQTGWGHRQRALSQLERSSRRIRYFLPAMLNGLLQTFEYAHASVYSPVLTGGDLTSIAANKVMRQAVLDDLNIQFSFVLTHSAITWPLVPPEQLTRQYQRLLELSRKPNISIRIVDSMRPVVGEGPLNTFVIYDDRLLTAELFSGEVTLTSPADIEYHGKLFDYFLSVSRAEQETREFIAALDAR
jgi:transcriptional regulator with XRE-family HTH domain